MLSGSPSMRNRNQGFLRWGVIRGIRGWSVRSIGVSEWDDSLCLQTDSAKADMDVLTLAPITHSSWASVDTTFTFLQFSCFALAGFLFPNVSVISYFTEKKSVPLKTLDQKGNLVKTGMQSRSKEEEGPAWAQVLTQSLPLPSTNQLASGTPSTWSVQPETDPRTLPRRKLKHL